jgi:hypothetical protein
MRAASKFTRGGEIDLGAVLSASLPRFASSSRRPASKKREGGIFLGSPQPASLAATEKPGC